MRSVTYRLARLVFPKVCCLWNVFVVFRKTGELIWLVIAYCQHPPSTDVEDVEYTVSILSGILQDHLGCHWPLLARHRNNSGWDSPREQVRLEESEPDRQIGSKEITHIFCDLTSVKNWLSELVHLTCYRICARGLSATIHYQNRSVSAQRVHVTVTHTSGLANKG